MHSKKQRLDVGDNLQGQMINKSSDTYVYLVKNLIFMCRFKKVILAQILVQNIKLKVEYKVFKVIA